jgi:hypothetical protein
MLQLQAMILEQSDIPQFAYSGNSADYSAPVEKRHERYSDPQLLHDRRREEIHASLAKDHGISISNGEVSLLCSRFLDYLERLHNASSPALKAALAADGGWPLHIDATGEDGRGTLFLAFTGWRQWVLGAWKIPTERADAILPPLKETVFRFGSPCAIVRDLGRAMAEAAETLQKELKLKIPVLACKLLVVCLPFGAEVWRICLPFQG